MQEIKKYYTAKELAERFGFKSHKTIERMAEDGELPKPVKIGRNNRWDIETIEAWERARK
jgi:predicted DNA-binding transcriptional regulator AlpA